MGEVNESEKRVLGMQGSGEGRPQNRPGGTPNAAQIIKEMDANNDGKLSKTEVKGPLKEGFSKIDANNNGFLSKEELEKGGEKNKQKPPKHN